MKLLGSAARVGENYIHSFANEAFDNDVGAVHLTADFR
jgi:hypothetical protein